MARFGYRITKLWQSKVSRRNELVGGGGLPEKKKRPVWVSGYINNPWVGSGCGLSRVVMEMDNPFTDWVGSGTFLVRVVKGFKRFIHVIGFGFGVNP